MVLMPRVRRREAGFALRLILALMLALHLSGAAADEAGSDAVMADSPPVPVRIALQWTPQSQFAGYYMARERGIYRAQGLDVQLLHVDAERNSLDWLRAGRVTLASANLSDALVAAGTRVGSTGSLLAQVAQLVQRSNLLLVAWKDMGIMQPSDLDGLRVSHWQGALTPVFDAFFAAHGISVIHIPQYASVSLFLRRGTAACAAMEYNEYHRIWQAGIDASRLTTFVLRDLGFGLPEDGLYGTADWIARHPDTARAVREATLLGWSYARDHRAQTIDVVLAEARRAGVPANRPHERWMLDHLLDSIFVPDTPPMHAGRLDRAAYQAAAHALQAAHLVQRVPAFGDFAPLEGPSP